jgi:Nucleotidyl transferase AbiEii toxin, Type IV TA system
VDEERLKTWETLFGRAMALMDSAANAGATLGEWSFGGGTVLMRRHRHRFSKDIDIFIGDPQLLGYLSPRLSPTAESLTPDYVEQSGFLKLSFPEGEIDFVVAAPLTPEPTVSESLFGRDVRVETSTEIIAKKVWYRGDHFTPRDLFDLAMVTENENAALRSIQPILRSKRRSILDRVAANEAAFREAFALLEVLEYRRSFDECLALARRSLN